MLSVLLQPGCLNQDLMLFAFDSKKSAHHAFIIVVKDNRDNSRIVDVQESH